MKRLFELIVFASAVGMGSVPFPARGQTDARLSLGPANTVSEFTRA